MSGTPILQFGTSRFLQAHVGLFVGEALKRGAAVGRIAVAQTTDSPESRRRVDALKTCRPYPVLVRGIEDGVVVDRRVDVASVGAAFHARQEWPALERLFVEQARFVVSNVGDRGYELADGEPADLAVPHSFPAKLLRLLMARQAAGGAPLALLPCELVSGNGQTLRAVVLEQARRWRVGDAAMAWVADECLWIDTLVDRIVSRALEPVGAEAEPYALWAIAARPGFDPPCRHEAILVVADLGPFERLKLFILNLGHTVLADRWLGAGGPEGETVREALSGGGRGLLEGIYAAEVLPAFAAAGMGGQAEAYVARTLERFANPFLDHRLADIAANHTAKVERRIAAFLDWSRTLREHATEGTLDAIVRRRAASGAAA